MRNILLYMAPLQGFTDAVFRHWHCEIYGSMDGYFTPFVRMEKGVPRERDMRDCRSELNANHGAVPQIIFRDVAEFDALVEAIKEQGLKRVDMNLGCPFMPQVRKGRGAGSLANRDMLAEVAKKVNGHEGMIFSVKMRLGVTSSDEWTSVMPILNEMKLSHVTIHPRTAIQQYGGEIDMAEFDRLMESCRHDVVYNGDINSCDDIARMVNAYPKLKGVMIGRGLLRHPSLATEWTQQETWSRDKRVEMLLRLHDALLQHAESHLCGDCQILGRLLPYWEYFGDEFDKKAVKRVIKSRSLTNYKQAVGQLI